MGELHLLQPMGRLQPGLRAGGLRAELHLPILGSPHADDLPTLDDSLDDLPVPLPWPTRRADRGAADESRLDLHMRPRGGDRGAGGSRPPPLGPRGALALHLLSRGALDERSRAERSRAERQALDDFTLAQRSQRRRALDSDYLSAAAVLS
eukprot:4378719-Prymnesium_polylepis.1